MSTNAVATRVPRTRRGQCPVLWEPALPLEPRQLLAATIQGSVLIDSEGDGDLTGDFGAGGALVELLSVPGGAVLASARTEEGTGAYSLPVASAPGTFRVRLASLQGTIQTTADLSPVAVADGTTVRVNPIGRFVLGAIAGTVFDDANGNGRRDEGESGLPGVTVRLRRPSADGVDGAAVGSAPTDENGRYAFTNLGPGQYVVEPAFTVGVRATGLPSTISVGSRTIRLFESFGLALRDGATRYTVTSRADTGPGTLRQAILSANADPTTAVIVFAPRFGRGVVELRSSLPEIVGRTVILGRGPETTGVEAGGVRRAFTVNAGIKLEISGLSISGGAATAARTDDGGAILSRGDLGLYNTWVLNSRANDVGGAIACTGGALAIIGCQIIGNSAGGDGGGIWTTSKVAIEDTTIRDNRSGRNGGAGVLREGLIRASTISGNSAAQRGGGLDAGSGTLTLDGCTLVENAATGGTGGGAIAIAKPTATIVLRNSTITTNADSSGSVEGAGGVSRVEGSLRSTNTIISENSALSPSVQDVSTFDLSPADRLSTLIGGNPLLDALGSGPGGQTKVRRPLPGSPVINRGIGSAALTDATDQRGRPRVAGGRVDFGAVESDWFGDELPNVSLVSADAVIDVVEGSPGVSTGPGRPARLTVQLHRTGDLSGTSSVRLVTVDGDAAAGTDYEPVDRVVTFLPGETTVNVDVQLVGDLDPESNERFTVELREPSSATIGDATKTLEITDDDGIPGIRFIADPLSENSVCEIRGTNGDDLIRIDVTTRDPRRPFTQVVVTINGVAIYKASTTTFSRRWCVVRAGGGNDTVTFDEDFRGSTIVFGGAGTDTLRGGGGPDVLVGGDGNDRLIGGGGDDVLIGGRGQNRLIGGNGDDVLVAGASRFDGDAFSLSWLGRRWLTAGLEDELTPTYQQRVRAVRRGVAPYADVRLVRTQIDGGPGAFDVVRGDAGRDLFFVRVTGPIEQRDRVPGRVAGESLTRLIPAD
jgi:hypothetical protein